jgi:hypothetical protein
MSGLPVPKENYERQRSKRKFIPAGSYPATALVWSGNRARSKALWLWRINVSKSFSSRPRCLRVAWILEWLFGRDGYAFPTDGFIAGQIDMDVDHVQAAMTDLERGKAIIRASVFIDGRPQRRIWPSSEIIPPGAGGRDTPSGRSDIPPGAGGQNTQEGKRTPKVFLSRTVLEARRAAQINEDRERMRGEDALAEGPAKPYPGDAA